MTVSTDYKTVPKTSVLTSQPINRMPYSTPTSPMNSPARETTPQSKKGFYTPPTHVEDIESSSGISGPMPGIPRRASSRTTSPIMSRSASSTSQSFSAVRPTDGLPRRASHTQPPATPTSGLPQHVGTLGLKLHPSPTTAPSLVRSHMDSLDSTSTIESSLPPTPTDEHLDLEATEPAVTDKPVVPFPHFESRPISANHPLRSSMSTSRPPMPRYNSGGATSGHSRGPGSLQLQMPSSASTSHLEESPVEYRPSRPTSMIRKKSGEVVKPSLKQRSMSTPDLTRLPEESYEEEEVLASRPFGEERSKSVRFADADDDAPGSALANVVLFLSNSKPAAVSKAADPDNHLTETETEADTDASDFVHFRTRKNAAARAQDDAREIQLEGGSRVPRVRCDFSPDARGALNGEMVVMERAELKTVNGSLCIQGTIICRNVAFQKWVAVRFTLDHWQTVSEVSGNHVTHVPHSTTGDEGWDRFSFNIKLEDYRRKLEERQLLMCIRFSVEGQEWWDSNNGLNYQFNFKRSSPRKTRHSLPPTFNRLGTDFAETASLPGVRQNPGGGFAPSNRIADRIAFSFGAGRPATTGPRDWTFPTLAQSIAGGSGSRSGADSPMLSPPPATAFRPPGPPDVHTHLTLRNHCAPSPPKSPSIVGQAGLASATDPTSTEDVGHVQTSPSAAIGHERRSSWAGKVASWDSFSKVLSEDSDNYASTDGSSTPTPTGAHSESTESVNSPASPPHRALTMKRSTGDLQALRNGDAGLMTPPSSQSPSPSPLKHNVPLPRDADDAPPMSPDPSTSSTGESSPLDTICNDSTADLANLDIDVDPSRAVQRGFTDASYQDFLDKFCFFKSPGATPMDDMPPPRRNYNHVSGHASPTGFPFFGSQYSHSNGNGHNDNSTPRQEYNSATDAFNMPGFSSGAGTAAAKRSPSTTPRAMSRQNSQGPSGTGPNPSLSVQ